MMSEGSRASNWLTLQVVSSPAPGNSKNNLLFLIPKRVIPLAARRNRIRRLLREAVRLDAWFKKTNVYKFRVGRLPKELNLKIVQTEFEKLKASL